ncbi:venom protease isoform X1 [Halyomorpha halys]|uniref:venom protease isoform X1 n=1 Tax=Halyomorpha halys TaxID=286706 RepID=UPI0006D4C963|nr:venom protease-like isoform X1 [Halyomorpha halys]
MILYLIGVFGLTAAASSELLELESGDSCRPLGGGQGTCVLLSQCETAGDFKTNRPPICGFNGREPIVCCKNTGINRVQQGKRTLEYCRWLEKQWCRRSVTSETKPTTRPIGPSMKVTPPKTRTFVVGGTRSLPRDHKYMVLIGYGETEKEWRCAGSLITARYVLSAAHCSNSSVIGPARWARLGELDISSTSEDAKPVDKAIIERIPHPNYIDTKDYYDIALFKLDSDVVFNRYVLPICLYTNRAITSEVATVVGWGRTGFIEATSEKLLEADIRIYNDTECKRLVFSSATARTPQGHNADQMICAGVPDGSKDACQGDSGGPLVIREIGTCMRTQLGITSFGKECGNPDSPGVYSRVSNYISWIEEIAFTDGIIF